MKIISDLFTLFFIALNLQFLGMSTVIAKAKKETKEVKKMKKTPAFAYHDDEINFLTILAKHKLGDPIVDQKLLDVGSYTDEYKAYMAVLGPFKKGEDKDIESFEELQKKANVELKKIQAAKPPKKNRGPLPESIGVATMEKDGTIRMQLRSEDHGMIAEALKIVKPGDHDYQDTIKHLNGIKPGEAKSIPPYEDL